MLLKTSSVIITAALYALVNSHQTLYYCRSRCIFLRALIAVESGSCPREKIKTERRQLENRLRAPDESRTSAVLHTRCWPPEPAVQLWPGRRVRLLFFVSHSNTHSNTGSELLKSKQGDLLLWRLLGKSRLPRLWGSAQSVLYVCRVNSLKSWVADIFFKARRRGSDTCVSLLWLGCIMWGSLIFQERQNELLLLLHPFYLVFRRQTLQR
jgi:hypothetical protein